MIYDNMEQPGFLLRPDIGVSDTMRSSSKPRMASLSSILGHERSYPSREKLGFRKLAKACSKTLAAWNDSKHPGTNSTSTTPKVDSSLSPDIVNPTSIVSTRLFGGAGGAVKKGTDQWRSYFEVNHENKSQGVDANTSQEIKSASPSEAFIQRFRDTKISQVDEVKGDGGASIVQYKYIVEKKSRTTTSKSNDRLLSKSTPVQDSQQSRTIISGRRIIHMKHFSSFVGLKSVIAQVSGGPLERVVIMGSGASNQQQAPTQLKNNTLELWFLHPQDAESFMKFCTTGMFLINGFHYDPQWAPKHHQTKPHEAYHSRPEQIISEQMISHGARRCLILKKYIPKKVKSSSKYYPSASSNLSDLNITEIKNDFSVFGDIIDVSPVISKKLCVAIHFFDVEASIAAKKLFEDHGSGFYEKYKDWTFWYGKDPAEKPCINI